MRSQALSSIVMLALVGAVSFVAPGAGRGADPVSGPIGHLRHRGYYTPNPYQPRYLFYPALSGGYPWYDYRTRYGWHSRSRWTGPTQGEQTKLPADARAYIIIRVPTGAELWFNGKKTTMEGALRGFSSPLLASGSTRSYEVRVRWQKDGLTITKTREVEVTAGTRIDLDFTSTDELEK